MAKQMMISEILGNMEPKKLQELLCLPTPPKGGDAISPWELPGESLDNFSYDGLGFEEAAVQLWQHMLLIHEQTGTANRHSDFFPIGMAQLEKDIRMAGSFCITRSVLEQQGQSFPNLPEMDVKKLLGLTAFYFRKCGKAFEDLYRIAGIVSVPMHDWERRWYLLSEQLKSTDLKIQKIRKGELKVEKLLVLIGQKVKNKLQFLKQKVKKSQQGLLQKVWLLHV